VSLLAIGVALDKFNTFAQQIYIMFNFKDLMLQIFRMVMDFFDCGGIEPLPLFTAPNEVISGFVTIQLYLVNAQGLLFFYWLVRFHFPGLVLANGPVLTSHTKESNTVCIVMVALVAMVEEQEVYHWNQDLVLRFTGNTDRIARDTGY
jgi:hypothetical protein